MRAREGGFTVLEILISLLILAIGMLGIMALQMATVKSNRTARQLERAKVYAAQTMEDLRGKTVATLGTSGTLSSVTTADGTVFQRSYTVADVPGRVNLVLVTVRVQYADSGDATDVHGSTLQMLRTRQEGI